MRNKNKARPGAATPERVEGKRAIIGAAVNPTVQSTTPAGAGQRSIADLLGVGRENAITRRDWSGSRGWLHERSALPWNVKGVQACQYWPTEADTICPPHMTSAQRVCVPCGTGRGKY